MASRRKDAGVSLEGSEWDADSAVTSARTPGDNAPNRVQAGRGSDSIDGQETSERVAGKRNSRARAFGRRIEWLVETCAA